MPHEPQVFSKNQGDVAGIVGPGDSPEVGRPAREGDVSEVSTTVNERGLGEKGAEQPEPERVLGHLVDDPVGPVAAHEAEPVQIDVGKASDRRGVETRDAIERRRGGVEKRRERLEALLRQRQFPRAVDPGVARQDLFQERGSRARQADDEDPAPGSRSAPGRPGEEVVIEAWMIASTNRTCALGSKPRGGRQGPPRTGIGVAPRARGGA